MNFSVEKGIRFLFNNDYRFVILSKFGFYKNVDDKKYLEKMFNGMMNERLNLDNPKTFNEKLQWLKLFDRKDEYIKMVDKYEAKKYISDSIGNQYIVPTIGIYNKFDDINFNNLPNKFVIKCTHDSGGIVICKDKSKLDIKKAKKKIDRCMSKNFFYYGREWPYKNIKPRIMIEKFLEDENQLEIFDYKFFCFNGKVEYLYVSSGSHSSKQKIQFFDKNFTPVNCTRKDYATFDVIPKRPKNFDKMIQLSEFFSDNIEHIRIDFYEINGKLYFGEFTFYTGSGYIPFESKEWDLKLGSLIDLKRVNKNIKTVEKSIKL